MKSKLMICLTTSILIGSLFSTVIGEVPSKISYQGRLTDNGGEPLDTTASIVFQIYADSNGVTSLWNETHPLVSVVHGLFQVLLGSITPIPQSVFDGQSRWLGASLSGEPLRALLPIVSSPYSYRANVTDTASLAKTVSDNSITSAKIVNGTIQFTDISQNGATSGQVMKWNGSAWTAQNDATGSNTSGWVDNGSVIGLLTATDTVSLNSGLRLGKLNVGGNMSLTAQSSIYWGTDSTFIKGFTGGDMTLQGEDLYAKTTGSTYFADVDAGNFVEIDNANKVVGVGTTTPEERLQVENDAASGRSFLQLETSHATNFGETGIRFKTPQNTWHLRMDDYTNNNLADGALGLRSQVGIEAMTWLESGNVGVGTTNPTRKLHVYGSAMIKDTLYGGAINPPLMAASRLPDEPGLASGGSEGIAIGYSWTAFDSASITTPGPGYIVAIASVTLLSHHSVGDATGAFMAISSSSTGTGGSYDYVWMLDSGISTGPYRTPASIHQVFSVPSAGIYRYYCVGARMNPSDAVDAELGALTLMYLPTSYGTVSTTKSAGSSYPKTGEWLDKVEVESQNHPAAIDNAEALRALQDRISRLEKKLAESKR